MSSSELLGQVPLTYGLMASVAVVSVAAWSVRPIYQALVLDPKRVVERLELHRLLTAGWLHGDVTHLLFNMLTLHFFAGRVVSVLGEAKFLTLYVTAVVVAYIPTTLRHRRDTRYRSVGASGAVAAIMFSTIVLDPTVSLYVMLIPIPVPGFLFGILYLVYSAYHSRHGGDNINHDAHFYGAAYGVLMTVVFEPARAERSLEVVRRLLS